LRNRFQQRRLINRCDASYIVERRRSAGNSVGLRRDRQRGGQPFGGCSDAQRVPFDDGNIKPEPVDDRNLDDALDDGSPNDAVGDGNSRPVYESNRHAVRDNRNGRSRDELLSGDLIWTTNTGEHRCDDDSLSLL
jgi:hypothetical protein